MRRLLTIGLLNIGGLKPAAGGIFVLNGHTDLPATGSTFTLEGH